MLRQVTDISWGLIHIYESVKLTFHKWRFSDVPRRLKSRSLQNPGGKQYFQHDVSHKQQYICIYWWLNCGTLRWAALEWEEDSFLQNHVSKNFHCFVKLEGREAACCLAPGGTLAFAKSPDGAKRKVRSVTRGRDNSATLNWNLKPCGGCSHDSDGYQHDRWLYITRVGEWRLSANQTVHFNFQLGRAILRGQRAIWLACKKYYPLSTSYHSSGLCEILPALIRQTTGSVMIDVGWGGGGGHGDTPQPQNLTTRTHWIALSVCKSMCTETRVRDWVRVGFTVWAKP